MSLDDDARAVLEAAVGLRDGPSPDAIASSLLDLEEALRTVGAATEDATHCLVPPGRIDESVAQRFARAAERWPRRVGGVPPSHERQAELLTAFDDARATILAAAECCRRAREILASTTQASGDQRRIYRLDRMAEPPK
jgi:hypothetical protein